MVQDKWFQRFIKTTKGAKTSKINQTNLQHNRAINFPSINISEINELSWHVISESDPTVEYTVTQIHTQCINCSIVCKWCKICNDAFLCTCTDATIKGSVCKHIHAIILKTRVPNKEQPLKTKESNVDVKSFLDLSAQKFKKSGTKHHITDQLSIISKLVTSTTVNNITLGEIENTLNKVITKLKNEMPKLKMVKYEPTNKKT
ncbi:hypothetical protein X975_25673, partial [Stegodyphus mimosarum]